MVDRLTWLANTATTPTGGIAGDGPDIAKPQGLSVQKNAKPELMLRQVANCAIIISRNSIVKNSTSLSSIWIIFVSIMILKQLRPDFLIYPIFS